MYRKPIFDAVKLLLGRGFTQAEVDALDAACDLAEAAVQPSEPVKTVAPPIAAKAAHVLGSLSEEFESSGRGPGTVSGGQGDPGGVSYGVYQLSSTMGTCAAFMKTEGKPWAAEFGANKPGSAAFTATWKAIALREADVFRTAQHVFIERTHYRPVVAAVADRKGIDLNTRHNAVRDMVWSCAVQHNGAPNILIDAIDLVDRDTDRNAPGYDRKLIEAGYQVRIAYVLRVSQNPKLSPNERKQLVSITQNRFPKELGKALKMLDDASAPTIKSVAPVTGTTIDGNAVAAANGVDVKSAQVKIAKLHPKMAEVIAAVAAAAKELNLPKPVITSGNDSGHKNGSLHYKDRALDFRGNNVKISVGQALRDGVAKRLGTEFDVLFEVFQNPSNNHLHVEYDPN